jgi:hypothetical protein
MPVPAAPRVRGRRARPKKRRSRAALADVEAFRLDLVALVEALALVDGLDGAEAADRVGRPGRRVVVLRGAGVRKSSGAFADAGRRA